MLSKFIAAVAFLSTAVQAEEWDEVFKGNGKDMTFDDLFEELSQKEPAFRWLSGNASNASNASNATNGTNATNATNTTQAATTAAATTAAATTAAATTAASTAAPTTKAATQAPNRDGYKAAISASFNIPLPAGTNATSFAKTLQNNAAFKTAVEAQFKAGLCGSSTTCAVALKSVGVKTLRQLEEAIQRRLATAEFVFSFDVTGLSAEQAHSVSSAGATELAAVTATFKAALKAAPAVLQALGLTAADVDAMTAGTMTVAVSDSNGKAVSTADLAAATTTKKATTAAATTAGSATTTAAATTSGAFEQSVVLSVALALFSRALF